MADSVSATVTLYSGFPRDQGAAEDTKNMLPGSVIRPKAGHTRVPLRQATKAEAMAPDPTKAEWRSVGKMCLALKVTFCTPECRVPATVQSRVTWPGASRSGKMK